MDAVFMDVEDIPFAVSFPDFIREEITNSKVLIALIGADWIKKINQPDDPVRTEIEVAISSQVAVLPVLIGNTPMPNPDQLPGSISTIARQNAVTVGTLNDFDTHMQSLLPKIESILGALAKESMATSDPAVISLACRAITNYLSAWYARAPYSFSPFWAVMGTNELSNLRVTQDLTVTLFLHRVARLAELLELHFILSFWGRNAEDEQMLAGWVVRQFERTPVISTEFFASRQGEPECVLAIRRSDEDAREVWKMITSDPLRLSLAYVATVKPKQ